MVELIHDHDVPFLGVECVNRAREGLDRREDVLPMDRPLRPDMALAEGRILEDDAEYGLTLPQNLVSMCDEQQAIEALLAEPSVVESGDPRLACASGRNHEIAEVTALAFRGQGLEHFRLEWLGMDINV